MSNSSACLPLQRPCPCTCWESRLVPTAPCSCCSVPKTKTKNSFCVTSTCLENLFLLSVLHSAPCHLYTLTHKHMLAHCVDYRSRKKSNRGNSLSNVIIIIITLFFTLRRIFSFETLLIIPSVPSRHLWLLCYGLKGKERKVPFRGKLTWIRRPPCRALFVCGVSSVLFFLFPFAPYY